MLGFLVEINPTDGSGPLAISTSDILYIMEDSVNGVTTIVPPPGGTGKKYTVSDDIADLIGNANGAHGFLVSLGDNPNPPYDTKYFNRGYISRVVPKGASECTIVFKNEQSVDTDNTFAATLAAMNAHAFTEAP